MTRPSKCVKAIVLFVGTPLVCLGSVWSPAAAQTVIRVDPHRAGQGSGHVVATLGDAIARLPALRRAGHDAIVIELASGLHRLERPVRIDEAGAGRPGASLILRGPKDGSARISGSVPLRRVERPVPAGAPSDQRRAIVAFALPQAAALEPSIEVKRVHSVVAAPVGLEIFDADGALTPARWPNTGWSSLRPRETAANDTTLRITPQQATAWRKETDLWIAGYLGADWSYEQLPALTLDDGADTLLLRDSPRDILRPGARFYVSHALAELDRPGEWWRDPADGIVYLIPRRPGPNTVEVSRAEGLIRIVGAHDVRIEHLTLERVRGDAVSIEGSRDIVIADCRVRWAGVRGVVVEKSVRSGVRRSLIADTGEGGVTLEGGDRQTLTPSENFAEDNRIVRFSRLGRTEKYGIRLEGVGARAVGNVVAHAQHIAIGFKGNNHLIALNELTDVVNETSDAGAIYTGRDITARGTIIRNNFLHDLQPAGGFETKGVYLDDRASGIRVEGNLFLRVPQPVFIGGGRDNSVVGNAFIRSEPGVFLDGRGVSWPLRPGGPPPVLSPDSDEQRDLRAMPVRSPAWRTQYPDLATFNADEPAHAKRNAIQDNVTLGSTLLQINPDADIGRQQVGGNRTLEAMGLPPDAGTSWSRAADLARLPGLPALPLDKMDRRSAPEVPADPDGSPASGHPRPRP